MKPWPEPPAVAHRDSRLVRIPVVPEDILVGVEPRVDALVLVAAQPVAPEDGGHEAPRNAQRDEASRLDPRERADRDEHEHKMSAVPRSGCSRTSAVGTAAMAAGTMRSLRVRPSLFGSSCRYLASAMTRKSFMNSLG